MIESEQKKRKIRLGWWYVRSLTKIFEANYPEALRTFEGGDAVLARELLLKSLEFPVYRNSPARHRAVALVMLRPYINDVIGKIALLNQYMLSQRLVTEAGAIFQSYQALYPALELQEWDRVPGLILELKTQIHSFENQPVSEEMSYPRAFGSLDPELQAAVQAEGAPKPDAVINFKGLRIDLDLKEQVAKQNTSDALVQVQKQCEEISQFLQKADWESARKGLEGIQYPPELVGEARKKLALIDKMFAHPEKH